MDFLDLIHYYNNYLFNIINHKLDNPYFDVIMPTITNFGAPSVLCLFFIVMFFLSNKKDKKIALLSVLSIIIAESIVTILKYTVNEPRPFLVIPNVDLLVVEKGYSFPSGHSAAAFAVAMILGNKYYIKLKGRNISMCLTLFYAILIAFSRIYIGVHYPIDVVGGGIVGIFSAYVILKFENNIYMILKN